VCVYIYIYIYVYETFKAQRHVYISLCFKWMYLITVIRFVLVYVFLIVFEEFSVCSVLTESKTAHDT
jgi:hypothetical protein